MPTDPRETLRRRRAENASAVAREREEAARRAPAAELGAAWDQLAQCTPGELGLSNSPSDHPQFYEAFAVRLIRVAEVLKAQRRLIELSKLEGRETASDHAISLFFAAANGMTAKELSELLLETARDPNFLDHVGNHLRRHLRDQILLPRAEPKQELAAQAADPPSPEGQEWRSATEAVAIAEKYGFKITLCWISRRKAQILTRPRGKNKLEVEINSLMSVMARNAPRTSSKHDTDEPGTDERDAIEARKRDALEHKRHSRG